MKREEFIKRLNKLSDQILEAEGIYSVNLASETIQMEWNPNIAFLLVETKLYAQGEFIYFTHNGWRIVMEKPEVRFIPKTKKEALECR